MAEEVKWVTFDSDSDSEEVLSLSDIPVAEPNSKNKPEKERGALPAKDDQFEFRIVSCGDLSSTDLIDMCAAEDVFFHGNLLPLEPARPVFRSDSTASISFDSSTSVSRSVSSDSCASSSDAPRRNTSNILYAYHSPSPRVRPARRNDVGGGRRRSTGTAPPVGWGLLRIGVAMAPEMELNDIRVRLARGGSVKKRERRGNGVSRLLGGGLMGCKCSAEEAVLTGKKKGEGRRRVGGSMERRNKRMFEWLGELSIGKEPSG